jgi:hypothetical protein
MSKRIDYLMTRNVASLSAAELDEIIAWNRAMTAAYEKAAGVKAALLSGVVIPFPIGRKV